MLLLSTTMQAAAGATFGLVPFVDPELTGLVAGVVSAGGNLGAVFWSVVSLSAAFSADTDEWKAFMAVGLATIGQALFMLLFRLHGASALPCLGTNGAEWLDQMVVNRIRSTIRTDVGGSPVTDGDEYYMPGVYQMDSNMAVLEAYANHPSPQVQNTPIGAQGRPKDDQGSDSSM